MCFSIYVSWVHSSIVVSLCSFSFCASGKCILHCIWNVCMQCSHSLEIRRCFVACNYLFCVKNKGENFAFGASRVLRRTNIFQAKRYVHIFVAVSFSSLLAKFIFLMEWFRVWTKSSINIHVENANTQNTRKRCICYLILDAFLVTVHTHTYTRVNGKRINTHSRNQTLIISIKMHACYAIMA